MGKDASGTDQNIDVAGGELILPLLVLIFEDDLIFIAHSVFDPVQIAQLGSVVMHLLMLIEGHRQRFPGQGVLDPEFGCGGGIGGGIKAFIADIVAQAGFADLDRQPALHLFQSAFLQYV